MELTKTQRDWLALALIPGVGTAHFIRLMAHFKTPREVLAASRGALAEVVGKQLAARIAEYGGAADVAGQERAMDAVKARLITLDDPDYPNRLAEIYDPPLLLFVRGELLEQDERCVAIVGTRKPSAYGVRMAEQLARELALRGVTVVSGMAYGVDAAAHRGAIEAGGRTLAVLGCGVDVLYPQDHGPLLTQILTHGAVVSQYPMGMKPLKGNFPFRNRVISGLTMGTIVIEAPARSGALITAKYAAEQGREVFAVPGQVGNPNSEGPHLLIQQGAKLVASVSDIIDELSIVSDRTVPPRRRTEPEAAPADAPRRKPSPQPSQQPPPREIASAPAAAPAQGAPPEEAARPANAPRPGAAAGPSPPSDKERAILAALHAEGSFIDDVAARCKLSIAEVLSALTLLELKGLVRQFSGKRFAPR